MPHPVPAHEVRSLEQLREQFAVERELAERLMKASRQERRTLYSAVYDEFFHRLPHLPQHALKEDPQAKQELVALQSALLETFLSPEATFVEIGSGDCSLALHLASRVRAVTVVEASREITAGLALPSNFTLEIAQAPPYGIATASVSLAFSCHFIEHLHPEDALEHLLEVHRILQPGGLYVCVTPNRIYGPHDVSRYFVDTPQGLHLKEYTHRDLSRLLKRAGFRKQARLAGIAQPSERKPLLPATAFEGIASALPSRLRRPLLARVSRDRQAPFRPLEQVIIVAERS